MILDSNSKNNIHRFKINLLNENGPNKNITN